MLDEIVPLCIGRKVLVDACVSRDVVETLKKQGVPARHIADIDHTLPDHEIAALLEDDELLITRDSGFYKHLGPNKAILLQPRADAIRTQMKKTKKEKRFERKQRMTAELRYALREMVEKETRSGALQIRILWGLAWLFGLLKYQNENNLN